MLLKKIQFIYNLVTRLSQPCYILVDNLDTTYNLAVFSPEFFEGIGGGGGGGGEGQAVGQGKGGGLFKD